MFKVTVSARVRVWCSARASVRLIVRVKSGVRLSGKF